MNKKIILITGANNGLGFETAKAVAKVGHTLIMACRNMEKGEAARQKIMEFSGNTDIHLYQVDLASFRSIRSFCAKIIEDFPRIDVLVNNAGVFTMEKHLKTEDGLELTMGVNFFGTFLLTNLLLPVMRSAKDARIVNVTSDSYKMAKLDIDRIQERDTHSIKAYSTSKLALMMFTKELAEREKAISVNAIHPGHVKTGIWEFKSWYGFIAKFFSSLSMVNAEEGAQPVIHMTLSPELNGKSGKYFSKMVDTPFEKFCPESRKRLWKKAEIIVALDQ